MAVHINEVIIRAIIVGDEKDAQTKSETPAAKKGGDADEQKFEIAEMIEEMLKNKKER